MSGTRAISTTSRRELSSSFFLQGKTPKEIHAILTETLACFLPGRAKDLSAPLYRLAETNFSSATVTDSLEGIGIQLKCHKFAASEQIQVPVRVLYRAVFFNRRALASILPSRERFSWNLSCYFSKNFL